LPEQVSLMIY